MQLLFVLFLIAPTEPSAYDLFRLVSEIEAAQRVGIDRQHGPITPGAQRRQLEDRPAAESSVVGQRVAPESVGCDESGDRVAEVGGQFHPHDPETSGPAPDHLRHEPNRMSGVRNPIALGRQPHLHDSGRLCRDRRTGRTYERDAARPMQYPQSKRTAKKGEKIAAFHSTSRIDSCKYRQNQIT